MKVRELIEALQQQASDAEVYFIWGNTAYPPIAQAVAGHAITLSGAVMRIDPSELDKFPAAHAAVFLQDEREEWRNRV